MKKIGILNSDISEVVSKMGHTDLIAIGDCGLPIPQETRRIDIALKKDMPTFIETLKAVLVELEVENIILAEEIKSYNPKILDEINNLLPNVKTSFISHCEFKDCLRKCRAVIRTGEQSPYANIILSSGVVF